MGGLQSGHELLQVWCAMVVRPVSDSSRVWFHVLSIAGDISPNCKYRYIFVNGTLKKDLNSPA